MFASREEKRLERLDCVFVSGGDGKGLDGLVERWREIIRDGGVGGEREGGSKSGNGSGKGKGKGGGKAGGGRIKEVDVRASDDVGNYVCGWLYYLSLRWFWKEKKPARVVFLHVPMLESEEELEMGRNVVVALVRAMIEVEGL